MQKLYFILQDNDEYIIKEKSDYIVKKDYIEFNLKDSKINIKFDDKNFYFNRDTDKNTFTINSKNNIVKSNYLMKELDMTFDLNIAEFTYTNDSNKSLEIKYRLEEDDSIKKINIFFE